MLVGALYHYLSICEGTNVTSQINFINDLLWGSILIYLLIGIGIYFTYRLNFIQFRHFRHMFSVMKNSRKSDPSGISSFQALCTSLAARVGTGNMAGVAVALTLGDPGAIFWMWLIAMLGMATAFAESALAQLYKTRDDDGNYRGESRLLYGARFRYALDGSDVFYLPDHCIWVSL